MRRMADSMVLAFAGEEAGAAALAQALALPLGRVQRHDFPDGEVRLTLPTPLPPRVLLVRSLHQPNAKLAELLIAAPAARELGARQLVLVAPYLAYMRQDMAFEPGQAVSQRHVAGLLGRLFDQVLTVDPHLHRIHSLDEVMPAGRGLALSAAPLLGRWVAQQVPGALLVGPDEESGQWVAAAAQAAGLAQAVCVKQRRGDRDVSVALPAGVPMQGRAVVLLDDVASSGHTLRQAARACLAQGAASVDAVVTHALMNAEAQAGLHAAGVRHFWSSDAVPHPSNVVALAPLLAQALR